MIIKCLMIFHKIKHEIIIVIIRKTFLNLKLKITISKLIFKIWLNFKTINKKV
jgi:hypothetical protein